MEKTGKFIVIEGIDGSGKSTQIKFIADFILKTNKYNHIILTREPYKQIKIREILKQNSNPYSEAEILTELFVNDRKEHVDELILPALKKGINVISDRYKYATIVYQSIQGIPIEKLINLHSDMIIPDLVLIFDLPSSIARERMNKDSRDEQKFEKNTDFLEKVRQKYLELPKLFPNENIVIVDASKRIEEIKEKIEEILLLTFKN